MKNSIIDKSQKNSISIAEKVSITSKREQNAIQNKENIESAYADEIDKNLTFEARKQSKKDKKNDFLEKKKSDNLNAAIEKHGIEYHKNFISNKLQECNDLNKEKELIESLKKKYASSEELLNCIKIYSEDVNMNMKDFK